MCSEMIHVLLVSFPSQGHINPFLRLAKRLASAGLLVTFCSTSTAGHKIHTASNTSAAVLAGAFTSVGKGYIRFEFFSDGWDNDDPRKLDVNLHLPQIHATGTVAVAELIGRHADGRYPVRCVLGNPFIPWVLDVAVGMGIPCGVLWIQSCAVFSACYHYHHKLVEFPSAEKPDLSVVLPGIPALSAGEIPTFLQRTNPYPSITKAILTQFQNLDKARWVLVNSFQELEGDVVRALSPNVQLIPIGPLVDLPEQVEFTKRSIKGDLFQETLGCTKWLDSKEVNSVVYVSVGSIVKMSKEEMMEMAWGLRETNHFFLWVVRDDQRHQLPERFEEDNQGKGMVVRWSPQDQVLSHPSIACFLTHCGWNSTLESLAIGVPIIAFPHFGDQPMDAKYLVDIYGVGVHLRGPRDNQNGATPTTFMREDIVKAVQEVTEGPQAEKMRNNADKFKKVVKETLGEGGSSYQNIKAFHDELTNA